MSRIVFNDEKSFDIVDFTRFADLTNDTIQVTASCTVENGNFDNLVDQLQGLDISSLKIVNDNDVVIYHLTDINAHITLVDETLMINEMQTRINIIFDKT